MSEYQPALEVDASAVRSLIQDAFTRVEFRRLCLDSPIFAPILDRVAPDATLEEMADAIVEYCRIHFLFPDLLHEIQIRNPTQYARYDPQSDADASSSTATERQPTFTLISTSIDPSEVQESDDLQHGLLTHYLLQGLAGEADRAGKGAITAPDLAMYAREGVALWGAEHGGRIQTPDVRIEGREEGILAAFRREAEVPGDRGAPRSAYLDFDIGIDPAGGGSIQVRVRQSPVGEAVEALSPPLGATELEMRLEDLRIALLRSSAGLGARTTPPDVRVVQEFGQRLFDALFAGHVGDLYRHSYEVAIQKDMGLRLRLRIEAPELDALPWELLYDQQAAEFLCLSANTLLVRHLDSPRPAQPLAVSGPLRILAVVASPAGLPPLDVERQRKDLLRATRRLQAEGRVEIIWLERATPDDLAAALHTGPWHILHFSGHGSVDPDEQEGFVILTDADGQADRLPVGVLGKLLAGDGAMRLVVLNLSGSAQSRTWNPFGGTAAGLVRHGIPAVVAMQYQISDRAVLEFTTALYGLLAGGIPVDLSVMQARRWMRDTLDTLEWAAPVLYTRSADGVLFEWPDRDVR